MSNEIPTAEAPTEQTPQSAALPPAPVDAPASTGDAMLMIIERAARDPEVNIDKFERLLNMKRLIEAEAAKIAFDEAFAALLPDLPVIDRKGRLIVYSKADRDKPGGPTERDRPIQSTPYAQFDDVLEGIARPLSQHGFYIRFEFAPTNDGRLETTAILTHRRGHSQKATAPPLKHDTTGSKNDVQAVGSALSYGKRYALLGVLPIVSHAREDKDDDGRAAGGEAEVMADPDQIEDIERRLKATGTSLESFLKLARVESLEKMTAETYKRGVAFLAAKARKQATGR